ncbi:hypothetical protein NYR79_06730 [Actinobacillus equuli subsp. haemolyticus]|uniref:hypothetical protein n=1 Tax=Actinobacillus equuli TaxID=718 RepID=UPI00244201F7|nr:hypothetical protein [Actinobacillus equuli]WGE70554.1 hypothetical protein NYR79_06730 [Actinobacillus equuli subsp. haemolyticus]
MDNEFEFLMKNRPHVVLLGAGATMAAIPNGDKNGKKSSVMDGFIEKLGMSSIIDDIGLHTKSSNLEDIYTELYERSDCQSVREQLDGKIREYFSQLEIPDEPNIYDFILLSLRKKDLVATFNWDPLLLQAYQRVSYITQDLPDLAFLHGNVLVGYCSEHKYGGNIDNICPVCKQAFKPSRLLYPIRHKNYTGDLFTQNNWNTIKSAFKRAYFVTVFGYSAPVTDIEAISLLKESWGSIDDRNLEEFEFIDIRPEDELVESWSEFIHSHHYTVVNNFFDSILARSPRRTTVEFFDRTMNCVWSELDPELSFKSNMTWDEIKNLVAILVQEEQMLGPHDFFSIKR